MMGSRDNVEAGIIPRLSNVLFERIAADQNNLTCQVNYFYINLVETKQNYNIKIIFL